MIDMRSEMCKSCIHTKVCMKDKNIVGDVFVAGSPMVFDNKKLYEKFKEKEAQGFPCEDYLEIVCCKDCDRGFGSPVCPIQSQGWAINTDTFYCAWGERREE